MLRMSAYEHLQCRYQHRPDHRIGTMHRPGRPSVVLARFKQPGPHSRVLISPDDRRRGICVAGKTAA